jgi:hypothetical protein
MLWKFISTLVASQLALYHVVEAVACHEYALLGRIRGDGAPKGEGQKQAHVT